MFLGLLSEFWPWKRKPNSANRHKPSQLQRAQPAVPVAIPVAQLVDDIPVAQLVDDRSLAAFVRSPPASKTVGEPAHARLVRRLGSLSHLRALTPQEMLLFLLGQFSALMDSKDTPDWTINPAYHPEVNAFIEKHKNNRTFVAKARALQKNRAPFYGKTVVAGPVRKTILATGRGTMLNPPRRPGG